MTLSLSEKIIGNHITLERFTDAHITEQYIGWLNDPSIMRYSEQRHYQHDYESCSAYLRTCNKHAHFFYAITLTDIKEHIGNITAYVDHPNKIADLAILIGEKHYWGKGYGLEAWQLLGNHLFASGIRKITAGTMACNSGMLKIMQRSGMQFEGRRYKHFLHEGKEEDLIFAAMYKPI